MKSGSWPGVLVLACAVLACAALACASTARAAAEAALVVTLKGFAGMPADSASRRACFDAFRAEFEAGELSCEKRTAERWSPSGERRSRFQLVDLAPSDAAWTLELSIRIPPEVRVPQRKKKESDPTPRPRVSDLRTSRGLAIVAAVRSPAAVASGADANTLKFTVYFPEARRVVVPSPRLPSGGYAYPWADAGRVVARAALEALFRANDMMAEDERADLAPAQRTEDTP